MSTIEEKLKSLAIDVLNLSRNTLIINFRFMDRAVSMLDFVSVDNLQGIAVDRMEILFDSRFVLKAFSRERTLPARQYLHMILHCVFGHMEVNKLSTKTDREFWNLASDIAVENIINELQVSAVSIEDSSKQRRVIDKLKRQIKHMTADRLYDYFIKIKLSEEEIESWKLLFSMDLHDVWYSNSYNEKDRSFATDSYHLGNEGSYSGSQTETTDIKDNNYNSKEWSDIAHQMKMDLEAFSRDRGSMPGALLQNLREATRQKYNYKSFLRRFAVLGEKLAVSEDEFDYIFYIYGLNLYEKMPLIEQLEYKEDKLIKEFIIALDTSGSTSGELVQNFVRKTYNILKEQESFSTKFNIHIIQCDSEIREDVKITNQREVDVFLEQMQIRGMGGTDFRPVFSYVDDLIRDKEFTNLEGMIYFTDGFGSFPSKVPNYHVAVVYIDEGYENPEVPVWAIKLLLKPDEVAAL